MPDNTMFQAQNSYESRDYALSVTNGTEKISLSMRPLDERIGMGCSLTTDEARRYAYDILRRAKEVDENKLRDRKAYHVEVAAIDTDAFLEWVHRFSAKVVDVVDIEPGS